MWGNLQEYKKCIKILQKQLQYANKADFYKNDEDIVINIKNGNFFIKQTFSKV